MELNGVEKLTEAEDEKEEGRRDRKAECVDKERNGVNV